MVISNEGELNCSNPLRFDCWSSDVVGRALEVTKEEVEGVGKRRVD
jgi:hypothetical protein